MPVPDFTPLPADLHAEMHTGHKETQLRPDSTDTPGKPPEALFTPASEAPDRFFTLWLRTGADVTLKDVVTVAMKAAGTGLTEDELKHLLLDPNARAAFPTNKEGVPVVPQPTIELTPPHGVDMLPPDLSDSFGHMALGVVPVEEEHPNIANRGL